MHQTAMGCSGSGRLPGLKCMMAGASCGAIQELHSIQRYNVPLCGSAAEVVYDLQAGRYPALAMQNEEPPMNYFADELDVNRYTSSSIRQLGVR